jgi:hypothetical protein
MAVSKIRPFTSHGNIRFPDRCPSLLLVLTPPTAYKPTKHGSIGSKPSQGDMPVYQVTGKPICMSTLRPAFGDSTLNRAMYAVYVRHVSQRVENSRSQLLMQLAVRGF